MSRKTRAMMSVASALALALLLASLAAPVAPLAAQGGWTCSLDFTLGIPSGWSNDATDPFTVTASGLYRNGGYGVLNWTGSGTTFTSVSMTVSGAAAAQRHIATVPGPPYRININTTLAAGTVTYSASGFSDASLGFVYRPGDPGSSGYLLSAVLTGTGTSPCPATPTPDPSPTATPIPPTATPTNTPTNTPPPSTTPVPAPIYLDKPITITYIAGYCARGVLADNSGIWAPLPDNKYCSWDNQYDLEQYVVPEDTTLVGWLTRVVSDGLSAGSVDLRGLFPDTGGGWASAAQRGGGNMCGLYNNPGGIPGYVTQESVCGQFPAFPGRNVNLVGSAPSSVAMAGWSQSVLKSQNGQMVIFEAIPILYAGYPKPVIDLTCPAEVHVGQTATFTEEHTGQNIHQIKWSFGDGNWSYEEDGSVDFTWFAEGPQTVKVTAISGAGGHTDSCTFNVLRVGESGGGALYRPLLNIDSDTGLTWPNTQLGLFSAAAAWGGDPSFLLLSNLDNSGPKDHTVIGVANHPGAMVYAVADGTVLDVRPLSVGACDPLYAGSALYPPGDSCSFDLYADTLVGEFYPFGSMAVNPFGLYKVTVSYTTGVVLEYYVANAPDYVRTGQTLLAGCLVGETTPYTYARKQIGIIVTDVPVPETASGSTFWMQAVQLEGREQVPILPMLYIDPNPAAACNAGGDYANCLFDPMFTDQGAYVWERSGRVTSGDGFTLAPGASIALSGLNLNAAMAYQFTVWAERPAGDAAGARMTLQIGSTTTVFPLLVARREGYIIAPATHGADLPGGLYTLRISNTGTTPFSVLQNCVTAGEGNPTPDTCYFANASFDEALTGWTTTGTIAPVAMVGQYGAVMVRSNLATIGQNVRLYADPGGLPHTYAVRMTGSMLGPAGSWMQVYYRIGGGDWIVPNGQRIWAVNNQLGYGTNTLDMEIEAGTVNGLLEFQFELTAGGAGVIGDDVNVLLNSICINDDFHHFPGGSGNDGGGGGIAPGGECDTELPAPNMYDDVGAWTIFHLQGVTNLYTCRVLPELERLNRVTYSIYDYAQWMGIYTQASTDATWNWANKALFPWLGGYLSNIALAGAGAIGVDQGGGCHDIFCLLESIVQLAVGPVIGIVSRLVDTILGLLDMVVNVLLPLVEAVVGLFVQIINALASALNWLVTVVSAFVTGISNAQPAPVPNLPNCVADPSGSSLCAVLYGLEQTVFADEGAYIIPLIVGLLTILQLQWLISKLSELLQDIAGRL